MIPSMAYERVSTSNGLIFYQQMFSATAARFCLCVTSSMGFKAPKALASSTSNPNIS